MSVKREGGREFFSSTDLNAEEKMKPTISDDKTSSLYGGKSNLVSGNALVTISPVGRSFYSFFQ